MSGMMAMVVILGITLGLMGLVIWVVWLQPWMGQGNQQRYNIKDKR
ncbi:hypothetical protein [Spirulina subsalsa]|nr:hypothetical protein [Spirulina subsalsa]